MAGGVLRSTADLATVLPSFAGGREGLAVPFQYIFDGSDGVRLNATNVAFGLTLALETRFILKDKPGIQVNRYTFKPTTNGRESFADFPMPAGVLLNAVVRPIDAIVRRGECYVRVDIIRGPSSPTVLGTLLQGYTGSNGGRAWPGSPLESPLDGVGYVHAVTGNVPLAGTTPVVVTPEASLWRLITARVSLTTNAVAGSRNVFLQVVQDGLGTCYLPSSLVQGPGVTAIHTWAAGLDCTPGTGTVAGTGGLPSPCYIRSDAATQLVTIEATGLNAGDQFDLLRLHVEEWRNPVTSFVF